MERNDVAVRVLQVTAVHETVVLGRSRFGTTGSQTGLGHGVDLIPGVAGERDLEPVRWLPGRRRLVGEGGEELPLQHHRGDVLVPHQANGVLVGEERIDRRAECGVEGLAALEVVGRVAHEDVRRHDGCSLGGLIRWRRYLQKTSALVNSKDRLLERRLRASAALMYHASHRPPGARRDLSTASATTLRQRWSQMAPRPCRTIRRIRISR